MGMKYFKQRVAPLEIRNLKMHCVFGKIELNTAKTFEGTAESEAMKVRWGQIVKGFACHTSFYIHSTNIY